MIKVNFNKKTLYIDNKSIELDYPVDSAIVLDNKIIVLYDPDSYNSKFGQFKNLIALDSTGKKIWTAELPTNESGDCYYQISTPGTLKAYSWKSYECEIDIHTGKINSYKFYK